MLVNQKKSSHLVSLEEAPWPDKIKRKIAKILQKAGVADAQKQKIIEPYAMKFGGRNKDGLFDLSRVKWPMVLDYFKWEAALLANDLKKAAKMQKRAIRKYQVPFTRYPVFESDSFMQRSDPAALVPEEG